MAKLLARPVDGVIVDHDLIKSFFLEAGNSFQESAKLAYRFQWVLARDLLKQGRSVIIDSTCNYQETLDQGPRWRVSTAASTDISSVGPPT